MSNFAAPPQLVENVPYRDLDEMHAFARRWREEHRGKWFTTRKLSGFCLLMKRAVYEKIGGLDERFGLGLFDDDDLAERARRTGFDLAVAHDLFVHHFGSRTFQGNGVDAEGLLEENARRFAEKWGQKAASGKQVGLRPWRARDSSASFLSETQRAFATQVDKTGPSPSHVAEPSTLTRSASEGSDVNRSDSERLSLVAGRSSVPGSSSSAAVSQADFTGSLAGEAHSTGALTRASGWGVESPGAERTHASVSLTIIVRNEEDHLAKCLESVRGAFDEIVIVDTGSTDRTKQIALDFGAKVFDFVWVDDFAAARNEALSHATGDYAFWLDADDVVEPAEREKLRVLLGELRRPSMGESASAMLPMTPPFTGPAGDLSPGRGDDERRRECRSSGSEVGAAAYVMRCACPPGTEGARGGTVVDHVRLFPIRPGVRWTYRVHEQILPALNRAKIKTRWTDIVIRHDGYADPAVEDRKLDRNIKILEREHVERPDDPFVLFNLGQSAVQKKDYASALGYLERSLALSAPRDSIVRKLYALIARVHQMTGNSQVALQTCEAGLKLDRQDAELLHRKAVVHRHRGESAEAEQTWQRILELKRPEQYCSFDDGLYGHITRRNLADLAAERGDHGEARRLWEAVLAECPSDRQALAGLERATVASGAAPDFRG